MFLCPATGKKKKGQIWNPNRLLVAIQPLLVKVSCIFFLGNLSSIPSSMRLFVAGLCYCQEQPMVRFLKYV